MPNAPKQEFQTHGGRTLPALDESRLFDEIAARDFAEFCGLSDSSEVSQLQEDLNRLGSVALSIETEPPVREQRADLKALDHEGRQFLKHLREADLSTRRNIFATYPNVHLDHEADCKIDSYSLFLRDIDHLERLLRGVENALEPLPRSPGRPGVGVLAPLCGDLIELYERSSGESFTYERSSYDADPGTFITPGSRFVAHAALAIFPEATVANADTAIRNAMKARR